MRMLQLFIRGCHRVVIRPRRVKMGEFRVYIFTVNNTRLPISKLLADDVGNFMQHQTVDLPVFYLKSNYFKNVSN